MKWIKLGKIFDPTNHSLDFECRDYAQSPQALVLNDRVRIYFSTRIKDAAGKFLSTVHFIDFSLDFQKIIGNSEEPVIGLGELGAFDEHGIFPFSPIKVRDEVWAYTCGWSRRVSVAVETSTGLAISKDGGVRFERYGNGPILSNSLFEPMLVGDSFVRQYENQFHMWYIFGKYWLPAQDREPPARVYKIAYANSDDGINWVNMSGRQIIADYLNVYECQALPTVIDIDGTYHMYFCYRYATDFRINSSRAYRLGYAYSFDLKNWIRSEEERGIDITENSWDSEMICYPNLFSVNNKVYMLYNGNQFGKFGFGLAQLEV